MRELIAGMRVSVDGVFDGPEEALDWVNEWSDGYGVMDRVDACVLGARMYPGYEAYWTAIQQNPPDQPLAMTGEPPLPGEVAWARFAATTPHYVLSTSMSAVQWSNTTLLRDLYDVAELKRRSGKAIYLVGGGQFLMSCLDAGLVDELRLLIHPLIAGEGHRLFATPLPRRALALQEARPLDDGRVSLVYRMA